MKKRMMAVFVAGGLLLAQGAFGDCFTGDPPCEAARPEGGGGALFVDELGLPFFAFSDLDGDSFLAQFAGDPSDFIRQTPDGRFFIHFNDGNASMRADIDGLRYWSLAPLFVDTIPLCGNIATCPGAQGGPAQVSWAANCPVFDPAEGVAACTFGEGLISINARADGFRQIDGASCTISAHLTGRFVDDGSPACAAGSETCIQFPNDRNQIDISVDCD